MRQLFDVKYIMGLLTTAILGKKEKESLDQGCKRPRKGSLAGLTKAVAGKSTSTRKCWITSDALLSADVGIDTTVRIIKQIEQRVANDKYINTSELNGILQQEIEHILVDARSSPTGILVRLRGNKPYVILVSGSMEWGRPRHWKLAIISRRPGNRFCWERRITSGRRRWIS